MRAGVSCRAMAQVGSTVRWRGHKESGSEQLVAETLGQVVDKLVDPRGVGRIVGNPVDSRGLQVQGCTAFFEENSG